MTEADWLSSTVPTRMVEALRGTGTAGDRKLLLFGAACCRRLLVLFPNGAIRRAAECGERHADGQATPRERFEAARASAPQPPPRRGLPRALTSTQSAVGEVTWMGAEDAPWPVPPDRRGAEGLAVLAAHLLVEACGAPRVCLVRRAAHYAVGAVRTAANDRYQVLRCPAGEELRVARATWRASEVARVAEQQAQVTLLHDIFANPFRTPPLVRPAWLAWNDGLATRRAAAAYEDRHLPAGHLAPDRLAALAASLKDAGCTDAELLRHLRGPGPHVRGCWCVDLILGRE